MLPNYLDVSELLRVNQMFGLFFFDGRFRPVPLIQTFIETKLMNKFKVRREREREDSI
jgi:activating signal cointegrator complex subunit 3